MSERVSARVLRWSAVGCVALVGWLPAHAVDGAREINQACVATGCFPGDPPGFPVLITEPGSYVMTSNLTLPDAATRGIQVDVGNVTVDLGGFAILGTTVCTPGNPGSCAPLGGGYGVLQLVDNGPVSVRNGSVQGLSGVGVLVRRGGTVENISARHCGNYGVLAHNAKATGITANLNHRGVECAFCVLTQSVVTSNIADGVVTGAGAILVENTIAFNGGFGISGIINGYGSNILWENNGGNANPQNFGGFEFGTNVCGGDTVCP
jgi:hypothetical protein